MIQPPEITKFEPAHTAFIHLTIPRHEMQMHLGPAVEELVAAIQSQGLEIRGALFAHHLSMSTETFDFEVGFPISAPFESTGRIEAGERPAVQVARTIYQGPYEGLPQAWGKFHEWLDENDIDWASDIWECYLKGPESGEPAAQWLTELNRPLK